MECASKPRRSVSFSPCSVLSSDELSFAEVELRRTVSATRINPKQKVRCNYGKFHVSFSDEAQLNCIIEAQNNSLECTENTENNTENKENRGGESQQEKEKNGENVWNGKKHFLSAEKSSIFRLVVTDFPSSVGEDEAPTISVPPRTRLFSIRGEDIITLEKSESTKAPKNVLEVSSTNEKFDIGNESEKEFLGKKRSGEKVEKHHGNEKEKEYENESEDENENENEYGNESEEENESYRNKYEKENVNKKGKGTLKEWPTPMKERREEYLGAKCGTPISRTGQFKVEELFVD